MNSTTRTLYFYSGTHWDREWYEPFQGFRNRLVTTMNRIIEVLESNDSFGVFHLDGQTIVLEDFLAIEPDQKERLTKLIRERRLIIGPWYVMPDEVLLSGESLIRNLFTGYRICRKWGVEPWKYGFICDIFGHIAQMPQIFNGFGIQHALLGRGTNEHTHPAHFRWASPDGTECIVFKLNDYGGYGALAHSSPDALQQYIDHEFSRSVIPIAAIMDGGDHQPIREDTPELIRRIRSLYPDVDLVHGDLLKMGKQLESYRDMMPEHHGEVYDTARSKAPYNHLIRHTLSSRYPLKKANDEIQALLEKWVDPLAAIAEINGFSLQQSYIDLAYTYLLQNHPHDSICGCSIDQVHKDMEYRFDQARLLGENALSDIMLFMHQEWESHRTGVHRHTAAEGRFLPAAGQETDETLFFTVWNPMPYPRNEVVTVDIDFPQPFPTQYAEPFGYETINSFLIFDHAGTEIPYGIVSIGKNRIARLLKSHLVNRVDTYRISLNVELPAMGKAEYRIHPHAEPTRYLNKMANQPNEAENEYMKVTIHADGTLKLYDKRTGRTYDRLLSYLDDGEIGDGWYHVNPVQDRVVSSEGSKVTMEVVENGPSRTVFRVCHELVVPEAIDEHTHGIRRSDNTVVLKVVSHIGLSAGAPLLDVETTVTNTAKDHRLRLCLPTAVPGHTYFVNQPFAFVERKTGISLETSHWKEYDAPEKQMGGIVGKRGSDGTGLAFVSAGGLHECAAYDDDKHTLAVTLFRSFRKTVLTNGEEGGQIQGELRFQYGIVPLQAETSYADVIRIQDNMQSGVRAATYRIPGTVTLAEPISYLELHASDICMSILKRPASGENGAIIIRLYNLSDRPSTAMIVSHQPLSGVSEVSMEEIEGRQVAFRGDRFEITLGKWNIQTYKLSFQ